MRHSIRFCFVNVCLWFGWNNIGIYFCSVCLFVVVKVEMIIDKQIGCYFERTEILIRVQFN